MQKIAESKPNLHMLGALEKLQKLGFEPHMLQSKKYNLEKIREVGERKILNILIELSSRGAIPRKRILSTEQAYPSHGEFVERAKRLSYEGLATALKRFSFLLQTKVYLFWKSDKILTSNP
ncbi:MAG: hypothetical protein QXH37_04050 [Candidatus Bathyarchaeia archaeon]